MGLAEPGTHGFASEDGVPFAIRRSHTYAADGRESVAHALVPERHDSRKILDLSSSLGLWFMITQLANSKGDLPFGENSSHHATVSFADDGTAGVGATAAAAVAFLILCKPISGILTLFIVVFFFPGSRILILNSEKSLD